MHVEVKEQVARLDVTVHNGLARQSCASSAAPLQLRKQFSGAVEMSMGIRGTQVKGVGDATAFH